MLVVIPARGGSKRVPRKALKTLAGKSLLDWAIDRARASGYPRIVATEDADIAKGAERSGVDVLLREMATATDDAPDWSWAKELPRLYPIHQAFAILRLTSPFLSPAHIWTCLRLLARGGYTSVRCVTPVSQHPGKMWTVTDLGRGRPILRGTRADGTPFHSAPTQTLPPVYVQTAGLEVIRRSTLRHSLAGARVGLHIVTGADALDINTAEDWARAEEIAQTWTR